MRSLPRNVLVGVAVFALAGVAGFAVAEIRNAHRLDVRLPDGSSAHIRYVGDTPPVVSIAPAPMAFSLRAPTFQPLGPESPFAALERISEAMDREADAAFRDARAQPGPALGVPGLTEIDAGNLPPGARGYSIISTLSGTSVCTQSVQYRSLGYGKAPQIATHTSGDCTADQRRSGLSAPPVSSRAVDEKNKMKEI